MLLGMLVVLFHLLLSGKLVFLLCLQLLERLVSPSEMVLLGMASVMLGTPLDLRTLSRNLEMAVSETGGQPGRNVNVQVCRLVGRQTGRQVGRH